MDLPHVTFTHSIRPLILASSSFRAMSNNNGGPSAFIDYVSRTPTAREALVSTTTPEQVVEVARWHGFSFNAADLKLALVDLPLRSLLEAGLESAMVPFLVSRGEDAADQETDSSSIC